MNCITVKIKIDGEFECFKYSGDLNIPVSELLERLDRPIEYSCSCLQGLCGACAMVINSAPKLACKTFLKDELMVTEYNQITIEPLSKFPLIKDLKVDRSVIYDALKECRLWLESDAEINSDIDFEYEMSLCLMCGCCMEACPNYGHDAFVGTPVAVVASKLISQENDSGHLNEMKKGYKERFYPSCVKSIACEDICPMGIRTQRAISKMNRNSIWKIWDLIETLLHK